MIFSKSAVCANLSVAPIGPPVLFTVSPRFYPQTHATADPILVSVDLPVLGVSKVESYHVPSLAGLSSLGLTSPRILWVVASFFVLCVLSESHSVFGLTPVGSSTGWLTGAWLLSSLRLIQIVQL